MYDLKLFSVIIPTLMTCPDILTNLLNTLERDEAVAEVIIIDNTDDSSAKLFERTKKKVTVYSFGENTYVNPSWNFGVDQANYQYIALLNDDILIPENIFSIISQVPIENFGVLGAYEPLVQNIDTLFEYHIQSFHLVPVIRRWNAFGIFMVMHKSNYYSIPDGLNVWFGDDFIFHRNRVEGNQNGVLSFPIKTQMSNTSALPEFDPVKHNDQILYDRIRNYYQL